MYHEINSNLQNFVCQLKKTFLNIVWGLPSGTENALRKEISTAALRGLAGVVRSKAVDSSSPLQGSQQPATTSVLEDAAQGICRETPQGDSEGMKLCFFHSFFF